MKYLLIFSSLLIFSIPVLANYNKDTVNTDIKKMEGTEQVIRKISPYSVGKTMDEFEKILKKKGFDIFARIDHQKNAHDKKLKMNPAQVIIFGNPKGGTQLMRQDIRVALDLPLRVAIYQADDEKVYIAYHDPKSMVSPYDLAENKVISKLTGGLDKLTSAAIAGIK